MMHRLGGQPDSYDKKCAIFPCIQWLSLTGPNRSKYRFGRTLGAGTYGIVRDAEGPQGKCAIKIILKKNVRGNEQMVYDEMDMLAKMHHPHIVKFYEWFESKVGIGAAYPVGS